MLMDIQMQKISSQEIFFNFWWQSDHGLTCVRNAEKNLGLTKFRFRDNKFKAYRENYPDFEILVHIIQHGLQGFIMKYRR